MRIPSEVGAIIEKLADSGYEGYVVGGCVRDVLLNIEPNDWDVATNAVPEEIQKVFPDSFYENAFGTVGVKTESKDPRLAVVEVTTYRTEEEYSDKRHPDAVHFAKTIEEDLARRDFTMNAMALGKKSKHDAVGERIVDPFDGQNDLVGQRVRAVGEPAARFGEDALRLMRAVRFAASFDFAIEKRTEDAIREKSNLLRHISVERIAQELRKMLMVREAHRGAELLRELGLIKYVLPELELGWAVTQNKHHIYTVWEHNVRSLQYAAYKNYSFHVRCAALLHDVGKPQTKRGEGPDATFYGHEIVGGRLAVKMLERLRFPKHDIEKIALLVRAHMFNYDPEVVTDASVRRLVAKVGPENIRELVQVREADRIGSGVPKAIPYKLRHFLFRVEKVLTEPISRKVMVVSGNDMMELLSIPPGPRVGAILDLLFEEILDNPDYNSKEYLLKKARELGGKSDHELVELRARAQEKYRNVLEAEEHEMKKKYHV